MTLTQITEKGIKDGEIVNADINASAAIAKSKLASLDIVNADINASASIAGTKIAPNFGSQDIVTTGNISAQAILTNGNITVSNTYPCFNLTDTNNDSDWQLRNNNGQFAIQDLTNSTQRFCIGGGGRVGINQASPDANLHITGDTPKFRIESTNSLQASAGTEEIGRIEFEGTKGSNNNVAASMRVRQDGTWSTTDDFFSPTAIELYTQDQSGTEVTTPRVTINSSGNVGIGTSSPAGKVHANSAANTATFLAEGEIDNPSYPSYGFSGQNADNGARGAGMYLPADSTLAFSTAGDERLRIDAGGNVGIGTTDPDGALEVVSNATDGKNAYLGGTKNNDGSSAVRRILFGTTNYRNFIQGQQGSGGSSFSNTHLLLNPNGGDVGIGTNNPATKFEVQTAANERIQFLSNGSNQQPRIDLIRDSGTDYSIINAVGAYQLKQNSDEIYQYAGVGHRFYIGGTEKVRLKDDGNVELFDGDLKVASGHGIDFSATGNSSGTTSNELFNDYEEGSFTPVLQGTTTAGVFTYHTQQGLYRKIGKTVHFQIDVRLNGITTAGSGYVIIIGFPYGAVSSPYGAASVSYYTGWTGNAIHAALINVNNAQLYLYKNLTTGNITNAQMSDLTTSSRVVVAGTYATS